MCVRTRGLRVPACSPLPSSGPSMRRPSSCPPNPLCPSFALQPSASRRRVRASIVSRAVDGRRQRSHRATISCLAKAITHVTSVLDPADLVPRGATVLRARWPNPRARRRRLLQAGAGFHAPAVVTRPGRACTNASRFAGVSDVCRANAWRSEALRHRRSQRHYFGDVAPTSALCCRSQPDFRWDLPLSFFIENTLYSVSTTVAEATGEPAASPGARSASSSPPGWSTQDPLAFTGAWTERIRGCWRWRARRRRGARLPFFPIMPFPAAPSSTAPRRKRRVAGPATPPGPRRGRE